MKVCLVAEGCYPYVVGGVSSWIHSLIKAFPDQEFILLAIVADRSVRGKFVYEIPENLTEIYELYLEDADWVCRRSFRHSKPQRMNDIEYGALRSLVLNQKVDWAALFDFFQKPGLSLNGLLMGTDFFHIISEYYYLKFDWVTFSDFLWTMRSIYLPLFHTLKMKIPRADIYHCVAAGYAGVLGSMAVHQYGSKLLISEHGIYTREREEEIIKADWVEGIYKDIWIRQFQNMSKLAYDRASLVTSLYEHARELQVELGCPLIKTRVTPNGIDVRQFEEIPGRKPEDEIFINVGAVVRVVPIKDVMTMLQAFGYAKARQPKLKLWVMGAYDEDEDYASGCFELVETMKIKDVVFTGRIDVRKYLGRMDMMLLTSISEGQPLTILESFAAHKPVIATDVGNCRGLLYGEKDDFGEAGILTHIMNIEEISQAILDLADHPDRRKCMGECGYQRVMAHYRNAEMKAAYRRIYQELENEMEREDSAGGVTDEQFAYRYTALDLRLSYKYQNLDDQTDYRYGESDILSSFK